MRHDWDVVDSWSTAQAHLTQASTTSKQKWKFKYLCGTPHPVDHVDTDKIVVNLTDKVLDLAALSVLSRGLNFVQTTNIRSCSKGVISRIEQAIQQETSWIIRHTKLQKKITSRVEQEALLNLWSNDSIMILPQTKAMQPSYYQARTTATK
jgi:hypothetical protein